MLVPYWLNEERKMNLEYSVIGFLLLFPTGKVYGGCNYLYKYSCHERANVDRIGREFNTNFTKCSLENIPDKAQYILIGSKNSSNPTGTLKVNLYLPSVNCNYRVGLLVNDTVKNDKECALHNFENALTKELHSLSRTVCISAKRTLEEETKKNELDCQKDTFTVYFEHVYTGCYALHFTIDGYRYIVRARKFIPTNYRRTEVEEPKYYICSYDEKQHLPESRELVTFIFTISILSGTPRMNLALIPLSSEHENKKDACIRYGRAPVKAWNISLLEKNRNDDCSIKPNFSNGTITNDVDCTSILPVPYNDSYCLFIALNDERCMKNKAWKPPLRDKSSVPCTWIPRCTRIVNTRVTGIIVDSGDGSTLTTDPGLLLSIGVGSIILICIMSATIFSIYRSRMRRIILQSYLDANLGDLNVIGGGDGGDTDDDNEKIEKVHAETKTIVFMYATGSKSFMGFMSEFREIIKVYCSCDVYDWYAACEWDEVARVGAYDWAVQLIKKNYCIVWIDTPAARSLISAQSMANNLAENESENIDMMGDFRDISFPTVLNYAKRNIVNSKLKYIRHFIIRLEGYDISSATDDPFADLSPDTRYLIPYHLNQLCSHLSSRRSDSFGHALIAEEVDLRKRLIQTKNDF